MGQVLGYLYNEQNYRIKEVVQVTETENCHSIVERLIRECSDSFPVLGLDCEWVPENGGKKNPVALLQLATKSGFCALFRLSHLQCIPEHLKSLLRNEEIFKVGVGIHNDVLRLKTDVRSWVDIRHYEFLLSTYPVKEPLEETSVDCKLKLGLASLARRVLGIELNKDGFIRYGKWDAQDLSEEQIHYAAWDAFAAVLICYELTNQQEAIQAYSLMSPTDFLKKFREILYKYEKKKLGSNETGRRNGARILKKKCPVSLPSRKSPMYDNIFLLAPDGEILCTCDRKRAMWYVEKGIGELLEDCLSEESEEKKCLKVQLKFEPSRRAIDESEKYYCLVKDNVCVVCGENESYLRKHIVPHEYRKYFPVWMKSHQSHDILLLCINCHIRSNHLDLKLRQKLAEDCSAPFSAAKAIEMQGMQELKKVQSAAKALSRNPSNIPEERRKELEKIVVDHFSSSVCADEVASSESVPTTDMLNKAVNLVIRVTNNSHVPHGLKVVKHFQETIGEEDGLRELEVMWRQHFVSEMRPKFLPSLWSMNHFRMSPSEKEDFGKNSNIEQMTCYKDTLNV